MCVAVVVFKPIPFADHEAMEEANPHGGGVAWLEDGDIRFVRGLTAKEIFEMQEVGTMSYPYILHYRWATHGAKTGALTHPFPLGPRAFMGELEGVADRVLMHNGVWHGYHAHLGLLRNLWGEKLLDEMSDTAVAAYLVGNSDDYSLLDEMPWATAMAYVSQGANGPEMDIRITGDWSERDGSWYSNLSWVGSGWWKQYQASHSSSYKASGNPYATPGLVDTKPKGDWSERCSDCYNDLMHCGCAYADPAGLEDTKDLGPPVLTWENYLKQKYGEDAVAEMLEPERETSIDPFDGPDFDFNDMVSDDPILVQRALERMMA